MRNRFDLTRRRFLVTLPLASLGPRSLVPRGAARACVINQAIPLRRSRLVYAVDDWPGITDIYCRILGPAGYEVRPVTDRAKALKEILTLENSPLVLITDYDGYPISAELLMHYCRLAHPGLRILMVTGYHESWLGLKVKPDGFLQKPFQPWQLLAEIRALAGPRSYQDN